MLSVAKAEKQLFGDSTSSMKTRPKMFHKPYKDDPMADKTLVFTQKRILNKDVYLSPKSNMLVAVKRPKQAIKVLATYPSSDYVNATTRYLDESKDPKKNQYYLLVDTPELDFHQTVIATTDKTNDSAK